MNNITTFETSKALISAGFPVPRPEVWQFWHDISGEWYLVYAVDENTVSVIDNTGTCWNDRNWDEEDMIPAFTAVDILRELGYSYELKTLTKREGFMKDEFMIFRNINDGNPKKVFCHANPAEAAALAWLSKK